MNAARAHEANIVRPMDTCMPPTWHKHSPKGLKACHQNTTPGYDHPTKGGEDCHTAGLRADQALRTCKDLTPPAEMRTMKKG